ncbi:hypothetical protein J6590_088234 [Homalodisca vitripennis]|nr:hypothetical protein J6590_088234 [Homalodisca vitripennis]
MQVKPTLGTAKTDVSLKSGQPYWCPGVGTSLTANFEILGRKVGGVCSLGVKGSCQLIHMDVPPPACFDGRLLQSWLLHLPREHDLRLVP